MKRHTYDGDTPEPCIECGKHPDSIIHREVHDTEATTAARIRRNRAEADEWPQGGAENTEPPTGLDAITHDDCGCEVCKAIIDAIADTVPAEEWGAEPTRSEAEAEAARKRINDALAERTAQARARRESYELGHKVGYKVGFEKGRKAREDVPRPDYVKALEQFAMAAAEALDERDNATEGAIDAIAADKVDRALLTLFARVASQIAALQTAGA